MKLAILLCAAAVALAQEGAPTVDQVLAKYVSALGGKAALEKLTSRVSKGKFEVEAFSASGTFEQYAKAPDKSLVVINVEGYGEVRQGYDGQAAWATDPERGLRDMAGEEADRMRRGAMFYRALNLKQIYTKLTLTGREKVGAKEAWVLEGVPAVGAAEKAYFDVESGLLMRSDSGEVKMSFDGYKPVDGVQVPHVLRQESPQVSFTITLSEVRHNVPIEDAQFKKP